MNLLSAAEMREADRLTIEAGIPHSILMENAGCRVVEFLAERFVPLHEQRVVVLAGRGDNGGDGLVVARQLWTRFRPRTLHVLADPEDSSAAMAMLRACGCTVSHELTPELQAATLVVDALLGSGLRGAPRGRAAELIRAINSGFPLARVVAIDIPSGMPSDGEAPEGGVARADATVTFTAPRPSHVLPPNCDSIGELHVAAIGTPSHLLAGATMHLVEPSDFAGALAKRPRLSNKGSFGHVLVVGGADGKTGAAEMAGIAALRAGAGLVTVASDARSLRYSELMSLALPRTEEALRATAEGKSVIAIGPGLGTSAGEVLQGALGLNKPVVLDADALNTIALERLDLGASRGIRVLTPHPGEMGRLCGLSTAEVLAQRVAVARSLARDTGALVVLKGYRSLIAMPDGHVWVNPTGGPVLATAGTGDVLCGLTAGLLSQHGSAEAVLAAVYLHGAAGDSLAKRQGERGAVATDILHELPAVLERYASH